MAMFDHPTRMRGALAAPVVSFVVALTFEGVPRGVAGPFEAQDDADEWVADLLGGEAGWTALVVPLTAPETLPLAAERKEAQRHRRHLHVVR